MAPWTKTLHANFQVNRTNGEVFIAVFMFFSCYSTTKWSVAASFVTQPQNELLHRCAEFGENISFPSRVIAILVKVERFGGP